MFLFINFNDTHQEKDSGNLEGMRLGSSNMQQNHAEIIVNKIK